MIAEVTAGWLTTKAMASSMSDTSASSATLASCSTASSLRWFSGSDMSKRAASRCRAGEVGELSAVQLPDSQPPESGLYLLHQPVPTHFEDTIGAYRAAEKMLADGRARAIGVSNFSPEHLRRLVDRTDVVPAVNRVKLHPYFTQPALREIHYRPKAP